jgi:hypothetical protein
MLMTRRGVLRWAGAASLSTLPLEIGCSSHASPAPAPPYFTPAQADILNMLADAVLPPDDAPGGSALGVVSYIETLLTAFDFSPPRIYAGGPYSGREATPLSTGWPSTSFPQNEFATFLELDRFQTKAWMLRVFGSSGVPGGGPNDAVTGEITGLREAVASAISQAQAAMPPGVEVSALTQEQKTTILGSIDVGTSGTFIELVTEAAFTAPEYGGNPDEAGWKMVNFEGDAQPLGYSWFNTTSGTYSEDAAHPVSTANPGPDPMPMDATTEQTVETAISILGGKVFQ